LITSSRFFFVYSREATPIGPSPARDATGTLQNTRTENFFPRPNVSVILSSHRPVRIFAKTTPPCIGFATVYDSAGPSSYVKKRFCAASARREIYSNYLRECRFRDAFTQSGRKHTVSVYSLFSRLPYKFNFCDFSNRNSTYLSRGANVFGIGPRFDYPSLCHVCIVISLCTCRF